jgi:hypothetical protein
MNTNTQQIHKETLAAYKKLLEARLLLVECKYAFSRSGIRHDLIAQIDQINQGFTAMRWEDTRPTTGKVIDVVEVVK